MSHARLYFDFISPYSYLAVAELEPFAQRTGAVVELVPVVYGAILEATDLVGPVESPTKRDYTFLDAMRRAERLGLPFEGPPTHPFRSLEALRTVCLFRDRRDVGRLVERLMHLCWGEGAALTDLDVLRSAVTDVGLDATRLGERIAESSVKQQLIDLTTEALDRGVFGIPTFELDGELFWGHDRMDDLADRLSGRAAPPDEKLNEVLARPRGVKRRRDR